jgi:phosphatidylglycerophosphate synthase
MSTGPGCMIDKAARIFKDRLLAPMVAAIPAAVTPTMITLLSLPFGLAAAVLAGLGLTGGAVALFLVNRILDGLDGLVARSRNSQSDLGGYLDIVVDFVVYAAIPVGVWWGATAGPGAIGGEGMLFPGLPDAAETLIGRGTPAWPLVLLLSVFYVNAASWMYLSAIIEKRRGASTGTHTDSRPERHPDESGTRSGEYGSTTSVAMPAGLIEGAETVVFYLLFLLLPRWWAPLFLTMTLATAVGSVQRVVWAARTLRE